MILKKLLKISLILFLSLFFSPNLNAQNKEPEEPFSAPLIGFSFAGVFPGGHMGEIYNPFLSVGITGMYKTNKNWLWGIDGNFLFADNNVKSDVLKNEILKDILGKEGFIISPAGTDAGTVASNRGFTITAKGGKVFPLSKRNPNSGIFITLGAGFLQNQIIFRSTLENAPQLEGDYAKGYDNQMRGFQLSEFIGYMYMSNNSRFLNFYVGVEITQAWSKCQRDYLFYLKGKDNNTYFDAMYAIKGVWMFPLKSRKATDYYYY